MSPFSRAARKQGSEPKRKPDSWSSLLLPNGFAGTDRFQVTCELGAGGMGTVYEAFDREKEVRVALKTLTHVDALALERFKREFRALQGLAHPNVVSLGELLEADGQWFFTMELIEGTDLLSYVWGPMVARASSEAGPSNDQMQPPPGSPAHHTFDEKRLRSSLRQLACGVVALHRQGLIHRDIKPTNIMVTPLGRTVLMDFGLITETNALRQSKAAQAIGTPAYMAPEQAGGDNVSELSDWYSVGALLYEALTGRLPFEGSAMHVLMDKLQYEAAAPRKHRPNLPADLEQLCVDLLRRDPNQRPSEESLISRLGIVEQVHTAQLRSGSYVVSTPLLSSGAHAISGSHSFQPVPFVGRALELEALRDAFESVRDKPIVVLLEGESGMGKSALVEHFVESVSSVGKNVVVLTGRCYEREQVPYKAFDGVADSLCRWLANARAEEVLDLLPSQPHLLSVLFPVLKRVEAITRAPWVSALPDPQAQRTRMLGAFRELLSKLAARHRLIVVLDDLQWTCADSLALFEEVFGHEDAPQALILATMRPVDHEKRRALTEAMEMVRVRGLWIDVLPVESTRELATLLMPGRPSTDIQALVNEAGGHPLFVHELARHTQSSERGLTLDAALQERMSALPAHARRLLTVLCVAGRPLTQLVARWAADLDGSDFAKASSMLRVSCLARTDGSRAFDTIGPYHDRVREALVSTLDEDQRVAAHEALATALERTGGDARAIVGHAIAARMPARAAAYAEEAARRASATMAFDQAAELYETALNLGSYGLEARLELLLARADSLKSAGRGYQAAEAYMLAGQAAQDINPQVAVYCQTQAVEQWLISGHLDEGFAASTTLLARIDQPTAKTPLRALGLLLLNRLRLRLSNWAPRPRQEGQIDRNTLNDLDVLRAMAMGLTSTDLVRSADFNARFLLRARRVGEPLRLVQGLGVEASFLAAQGGRAGKQARKLVEQMASIAATRPGEAYFQGIVPGIDGIVSMNEGRFGRAAVLMEQAERVFMSLKSRNMLERNALQMFRMVSLRLSGQLSVCRVAMATFLRDAHRRGDIYFATSVLTYRTADLLASNQAKLAADYLAQTSCTLPEKGFHLQHYFALDARGELALHQRTAAPMLKELEQTLPHLRRSLLLRVRLLRVLYVWLEARLRLSAAACGEAGPVQLRKAARLSRKLVGEQFGCARVLAYLIQAGVASQTGRSHAEVVEMLCKAAIEADANGMASCAAAARYRLGSLLRNEEGETLLAEAQNWCEVEGVADPARYFEVIAPGFVDT